MVVWLLLDHWWSRWFFLLLEVSHAGCWILVSLGSQGPLPARAVVFNDEEECGCHDWCLVALRLAFKEDFSVAGREEK